MSPSPATPTTASLTARRPDVGRDRLLAERVPPPHFAGESFDTYRPDPEYPSQAAAVARLREVAAALTGGGGSGGPLRWLRRKPAAVPAVYLDGGFGVGKTHLLASIYHAMPARRKYFGSFIEYTALVGALGYKNTVDLLKGADLLCIDEFELDDPGDTMVMTRLIGELVPTGTKLAATSNTPPNALGEGRFAAQDFLREIHAMSDSFQTIRIDGVDFRQRALDGHAVVSDDDAYARAIDERAGRGTASDDSFGEVIRHLARVHPSRYLRVISGLDLVGLRDVHVLTDQSEALRFVAFVDRVYDAQIPVVATGVSLDQVFAEEMLGGGYRKKYLRAISRLNALTHADRSVA